MEAAGVIWMITLIGAGTVHEAQSGLYFFLSSVTCWLAEKSTFLHYRPLSGIDDVLDNDT